MAAVQAGDLKAVIDAGKLPDIPYMAGCTRDDMAGAFHSSELWYMFGTLDRCWRPMEDADLLDQLHEDRRPESARQGRTGSGRPVRVAALHHR